MLQECQHPHSTPMEATGSEMLIRSASLSRLLVTETQTLQGTTDPVQKTAVQLLVRPSSRIRGLLGWLRGRRQPQNPMRVVGAEERQARKQLAALRKAHSCDMVGGRGRAMLGRSKSAVLTKAHFEGMLLSPLPRENFEDYSFSGPTSPKFVENPPTPSPVTQDISQSQSAVFPKQDHYDDDNNDGREQEAGGNVLQRKFSKESALLSLHGLLSDMRRYSEHVEPIRSRLSLIVESLDAGDLSVQALAPTPYTPPSSAPEALELQRLVDRYRFLREFSLVEPSDGGERPVVMQLLEELDQIVNGLQADQGQRDDSILLEDTTDALRRLDFNPPADLMSPHEEASPEAFEGPKTPIVRRDLSHELLTSVFPATPHQDSPPTSDVFTELASAKRMESSLVHSPSARAPLTPLSLSRPELAYYSCADEEMVLVQESTEDPHLQKILENYRSCMMHAVTVVPQSTPELAALLQKVRAQDLEFYTRQAANPPQLFLIPLNEASVPKWVPAGSRLRVGRYSPLLAGKSRVISRNHCELFHDVSTFYLMDVGSSSGTFVNGIRISQDGVRGEPVALYSGDIIQLGMDYAPAADELGNLEIEYKCVQVLALLGYPKRATVESPHEVIDLTASRSHLQANSLSFDLRGLQKSVKRAKKFPSRLPGANVRIYLERGDLLHSDGAGMAVMLQDERVSHSAFFNNYKMDWEVALTDADGRNTLIAEALPDSNSVYGIMKGTAIGPERGRLTRINDRKMLLEYPKLDREVETRIIPLAAAQSLATLSEIPSLSESRELRLPEESKIFYAISGDIHQGLLYFVERSYTDRRQELRGEALLSSKKSRWGPTAHVLECRLALPREGGQELLMAILLMTLLQLERRP